MNKQQQRGVRSVHVEMVMGTAVSFDIRGSGNHDDALEEAVAWFNTVDARFSTYRADSEVSRFSRGELEIFGASADFSEVFAACERVHALSAGAFAAFRNGAYDPSAYVKGWSVDRAGEILESHGCRTWSINAGGDVRVASVSQTDAPWRIGVQHPFDPTALATLLASRNLAVATSGRYERGDHIVDPRTGRKVVAPVSTTVLGAELGLADAYSTAAFVLGAEGPAWVETIPGYECSTTLEDGRVVSTSGFPRLVHGMPIAMGTFHDAAQASD